MERLVSAWLGAHWKSDRNPIPDQHRIPNILQASVAETEQFDVAQERFVIGLVAEVKSRG